MNKKDINALGVVLLLGAQLLWSASSQAAGYYVDANSGNDNYSGTSPSQAFSTLKHAMRQLRAGDTLYVRSGEYHEAIPLRLEDLYNNGSKYYSGTSSQPITVKAYQNETPVIGADAYFTIDDLKWWVFEGLTFQNSAYIRIGRYDTSLTPITNQCVYTAENITIRDNRFQHGNEPGIRIHCGRHTTIENNVFDNLRSRIAGADANAVNLVYFASDVVISGNHFIDIGSDGVHLLEPQGASFTNIVIEENEFGIQRPYRYRDEYGNVVSESLQPFDNVGENAIDIKHGPGPILVSKNIIHGYRSSTTGQDASGSNGAGIILHNQARSITLSKNYFYDNEIHLSLARGNNSNLQPDMDALVRNNIFDELTDPETTGGKLPRGLFITNVRNVQVFNNTFHSQYGDNVNLLAIVDAGPTALFNNAFYNGGLGIDDASQVNLQANHNAWAKVTTRTYSKEVYPAVLGADDIVTGSLSIDPVTWEPLDGSPLIDSGSTIEVVIDDFNDSPITGLGHDIGAVEFESSQQPDIGPTTAVSNSLPADSLSESESGGGGGGGCTIHSRAKIDLIWLFIILASAVKILRKRPTANQDSQ